MKRKMDQEPSAGMSQSILLSGLFEDKLRGKRCHVIMPNVTSHSDEPVREVLS